MMKKGGVFGFSSKKASASSKKKSTSLLGKIIEKTARASANKPADNKKATKKKITSFVQKVRSISQGKKVIAKGKPASSALRENLIREETIPGMLNNKMHAESAKYETSAQEQKEVSVDLPYRYQDNRIVLLVRDPWWLHTYWDISAEHEREVFESIPQHERTDIRKALRVYNVTGVAHFDGLNAKSYFDIVVGDVAQNWYINVENPENSFCVDIGFLTASGKFYMICRSNIVSTPYFGISDLIDEEWVLPDEEYFRILGLYDLGRSSLERRRKFEEVFKRQISSFGASGMSSFVPSKKAKEREFFLEVHTELIVYGRTKPDATLTVHGKQTPLRHDGTFSFRQYLPKGKFEFPISATSSDKIDTITITPVVERTEK